MTARLRDRPQPDPPRDVRPPGPHPPGDDRHGRWLTDPTGQAAVELVALLPMILAVVLAIAAVLAAGSASESAGAAAEAGAAAILQDGDPAAAAKQALGPAASGRAVIEVDDRQVTVTVRPGDLPRPLANLLTATATAHAGPGPAADDSRTVVRGGDGEGSRPGDGEDVRPGDGEDVRPGDGEDVRPGDGEDVRPGDGEGPRPGDGEGSRPGNDGGGGRR